MKAQHPRPGEPIDPPMFWDPSITFMRWCVVLILGGSIVFLTALLVYAPEQMRTARGAGPVVLCLVAAASLVFLLRGKIRVSTYLLGVGLWAYATGISLLLGGLNSMFIVCYPPIIIGIGWLLGSRAAIAFAVLTTVVSFGFLQAELRGILAPRPPTPPVLFWLVQATAFAVSALMITYLVRAYGKRNEELRKLGDDLAVRTDEVQAREADLNRAQAVAHVGSWVYDIVNDVMHLSAETCRIFGLPQGTRGSHHSYLARVHPEDRGAVDSAWQAALKGDESFDNEHRILVGEAICWVRQQAELACDADGRPLRGVGTTQDITLSKRHEAEILAARSQLSTILDAIPDLLFEVGLDGRFHDYHSRRSEMLVASPEDFLGKTVADILPPSVADVAMSALREAHETGSSQGKQYELDLPHGKSWFELSVSRKPVASGLEPRFVVLVRDITERKRKEDEYRSVIQASTDGFWIADSATRILDANESICRMLGYSREELLRLSIRDIDADESSEEVAARTRELIQSGSARFQARHRRKDGVVIDVEVSVQYVAALGERFFVFVRDISSRMQAAARQVQLEAQLRESQKMEALGTLAGGVAHDFNNVLATIMGNVELAREDVGPGHAALESLEEIGKASRRAKELVQQILAFGRRQVLERSVIALAPVVEESARMLRSTLPAGVSLNVECAPEAPAVLADATQVAQVLLNLCANAWQAMQGQQRPAAIEISLSPHTAKEAPYAGPERRSSGGRIALRPGGYACLTVRDTGPGMDEATRSRIFEPFFTTKPVGKGTGLGLAVVHGIVQDHGASIAVRSAPGEGASFRIYFPAAPAPAVPAPGAQAEPKQDPRAALKDNGEAPVLRGKGKSILYVDDDEAIVFLMTRLLERQGYHVSGHTDPREALAAVRSQPDRFDLVVTDYNMPGMSGLELALALREIRADLPMALASGYITEELRAQAPAAGVSELIYKPNTVDELCEAVARLANAQPV